MNKTEQQQPARANGAPPVFHHHELKGPPTTQTPPRNDQQGTSPPRESVIDIEQPSPPPAPQQQQSTTTANPKTRIGPLAGTLPRSFEHKLPASRASQQESYSRFVRSILFEENNDTPKETHHHHTNGLPNGGESIELRTFGNELSTAPVLPPRRIPGTTPPSKEFLSGSHLEGPQKPNGQYALINEVPKEESLYQNQRAPVVEQLPQQQTNYSAAYNSANIKEFLQNYIPHSRAADRSIKQESVYQNQRTLPSYLLDDGNDQAKARDIARNEQLINEVKQSLVIQESVYQNQRVSDALKNKRYSLSYSLEYNLASARLPDPRNVLNNTLPANNGQFLPYDFSKESLYQNQRPPPPSAKEINLPNCALQYNIAPPRLPDSREFFTSHNNQSVERAAATNGHAKAAVSNGAEANRASEPSYSNLPPRNGHQFLQSSSQQQVINRYPSTDSQNERVKRGAYPGGGYALQYRQIDNSNNFASLPPLKSSTRPPTNGQQFSHLNRLEDSVRNQSAPRSYELQYRSMPRQTHTREFAPFSSSQIQSLPYAENYLPAPPSQQHSRVGAGASSSDESLRNFASQYRRFSGPSIDKTSPIVASHYGTIPRRGYVNEAFVSNFDPGGEVTPRTSSQRGRGSTGSEDSFKSTLSHNQRILGLPGTESSPSSPSQFQSLQGSTNSRDFSPDSTLQFRSIQGSSNSREYSPLSASQLQTGSRPSSSQESLRSFITQSHRNPDPSGQERFSSDSGSQYRSPEGSTREFSPTSASQFRRVSGASSSQDSLRSSLSHSHRHLKPSSSQDFLLIPPSQLESLVQGSNNEKFVPIADSESEQISKQPYKEKSSPDSGARESRRVSGRSSGEESFRSSASRSKRHSSKDKYRGSPQPRRSSSKGPSPSRSRKKSESSSSNEDSSPSHGSHVVTIEEPPKTVRFSKTAQRISIPGPSPDHTQIIRMSDTSSSDDSSPTQGSHTVTIEEPPKSKESSSPKRAPQIKSILRRSIRKSPVNTEERIRKVSESSYSSESSSSSSSCSPQRVEGRRKCPILPYGGDRIDSLKKQEAAARLEAAASALTSSSTSSTDEDYYLAPEPPRYRKEFIPATRTCSIINPSRCKKPPPPPTTNELSDRELLAMELKRFARALEEPTYNPQKTEKSPRSLIGNDCPKDNHDPTHCSKCLKDVADLVLQSIDESSWRQPQQPDQQQKRGPITRRHFLKNILKRKKKKKFSYNLKCFL